MLRACLLTLAGGALLLFCILRGGWFLFLCWPGFNSISLGIAHALGAHGLFGKRPDGTLPAWSKLLHLPLLFYATLIWHVLRIFRHEPPWHRVADGLVVGRRLLASEWPGEFTNFVDLTAEFEEPLQHRQRPGYVCYPILDGAAPRPEALQAAISRLRPGSTYVHCAQGHGRAALFALAWLLNRGLARSVDEALNILIAARPGIRLSGPQRKCLEALAARLCRP